MKIQIVVLKFETLSIKTNCKHDYFERVDTHVMYFQDISVKLIFFTYHTSIHILSRISVVVPAKFYQKVVSCANE